MTPARSLRSMWVALGGAFVLGCGAAPRAPERAGCRRVDIPALPADLERHFRAHGDPLVILGGEVFVCGCPRRHYGGRGEQRVVAGVDEQRMLGGREEQRVLGGAQEERRTAGAEESRLVAGREENRLTAGALEQRSTAGAAEARRVNAVEEARRVEGAADDRTVSGAQETRRTAGAQEDRAHGGATSPLRCAEEVGCTGWMLNASAVAVYDHRGLVPLQGRCVDL